MMRLTYDLNYMFEEELLHDDDKVKSYSFNEKVEMLREHIFNFDYPIEEKYRKQFETAFVSHFWFKEIGFETYTRWHYEIQAHLIKNGYRYNNLFQAQLSDIENAINMMNIETTSKADSKTKSSASGKGNNENESESFSVNRGSDVPQGRTEIDGNYISNLTDAKQVSKSKGNSVETSSQDTDATNEGLTRTKGYSGATLTQLYRMYAESMVIASDIIIYDMEIYFLQYVL